MLGELTQQPEAVYLRVDSSRTFGSSNWAMSPEKIMGMYLLTKGHGETITRFVSISYTSATACVIMAQAHHKREHFGTNMHTVRYHALQGIVHTV